MTDRHPPTAEQQAAVEAFTTGGHLVLQAGAGSGKTTTLRMLSELSSERGRVRRGLYIAFNKSIATEASATFPRHVRCVTAHALAFRAVGHRYAARLNAPRMSSAKLAALLGIRAHLPLGTRRPLTPAHLCSIAQQTVLRYSQSADPTLGPAHLPAVRGLHEPHLYAQLAHHVLPVAHVMWEDLQAPDRGRVRFQHDHYVKMWALTEPTLPFEFLLLDEAQDTNPVIERVFTAQGERAQLVMVGDSAQAIYGWRGARDVMTGFDGTQLSLSRSFRFGAPVAAEANRWLALAGSPLRLTGSEAVTSDLAPAEDPHAILCRTNGGAIAEILRLLAAGRRVALAGTASTLEQLAFAARDLKQGRRTVHPDLLLFSSWGEVQDYVEYDHDGYDLRAFVDVIDEHGVDIVLAALRRLTAERQCDVVVSTAHKAKGREWSTVRIAEDFTEPESGERSLGGDLIPGEIEPAEARLAYVAVTRARHRLDLGGLSWIHRHPDGHPDGAAA